MTDYRHVQGPSPWYLTGEDNLRVTSFGSASSVILSVEGRHLPTELAADTSPARPRSFAEQHTPNSDRTAATSIFRLGEGWLLNLQVRASSGTPRVGQVFVIVEIVRGLRGAVVPLATVLQGYVTDTSRRAWPGSALESSVAGRGVIRSITGTDPAAGSEISETVPTNARWRLHAIVFSLVTDATAANRLVTLNIDDGSTVHARSRTTTVQTASLTRDYAFGLGNTLAEGGATATHTVALPRVVLAGGHRIVTATVSLQAGDNYGAPQLLVEEWIED